MPKQLDKITSHLFRDLILKKVVKKISIEFPAEDIDVFAYLIRSIVSQQLSLQSAKTIYNRLLNLDGIRLNDPSTYLSYSDESLRTVGLSYQKASYVKNVCSFFLNNKLLDENWVKYSDKEVLDLLTQIKGVGTWTAQMVLMFALRRPDVFPVLDLGIQQGMMALYNVNLEKKELLKELENIARPWSPYQSYASLAIWRYKDLQKRTNEIR